MSPSQGISEGQAVNTGNAELDTNLKKWFQWNKVSTHYYKIN